MRNSGGWVRLVEKVEVSGGKDRLSNYPAQSQWSHWWWQSECRGNNVWHWWHSVGNTYGVRSWGKSWSGTGHDVDNELKQRTEEEEHTDGRRSTKLRSLVSHRLCHGQCEAPWNTPATCSEGAWKVGLECRKDVIWGEGLANRCKLRSEWAWSENIRRRRGKEGQGQKTGGWEH